MKCKENLLIVATGIFIIIAFVGCERKSDQPEAKPRNIYEAVKRNDTATVEEFLTKGVQIDATSKIGLTPLHLAAWHGSADVVEILLANGANINAKCRKAGMTPLHYAAAFGRKDIAEVLVVKGADINSKNKRGGTPLGNAAMGVECNEEVARFLIAKGADVDTKNFDGRTPLHKAVMSGQPAIVELLLSEGANISAKDNDGKTPLEQAIVLSNTRFRFGSPMAKRKKAFKTCAEILRTHGVE
jgi:ankyrin repeat protein